MKKYICLVIILLMATAVCAYTKYTGNGKQITDLGAKCACQQCGTEKCCELETCCTDKCCSSDETCYTDLCCKNEKDSDECCKAIKGNTFCLDNGLCSECGCGAGEVLCDESGCQ